MTNPDKTTTFSPVRRGLLVLAPMACVGAGALGYQWFQDHTSEPVSVGSHGPFAQVYVVHKDDQTAVDAMLIYPFGERHNPAAEGLAHYLEHLVWANIREAGEDGGFHSNALTSPMATGYWLKRPPENLAETIRRLVASAAPLGVSDSYAARERDIVQREFDARRLDDPLDAIWRETDRAIYGDSAFSRTTLGTKDSIASFTRAEAQELHDQTHHLSTATLLVRGPVTPREVKRAIAALDGWPEPRATVLPRTLDLWPGKHAPDVDRATVSGLGRRTLVRRSSFVRPPEFNWSELTAARDILYEMVFSTRVGSIARPLRYDNFMASEFDFGLQWLSGVGCELWMTATPDVNVDFDTLNDMITQAMTSFLTDPSEELFRSLKQRRLDDVIRDRDPLDSNAEALTDALLSGVPFTSLRSFERALLALSYEDFKRFTQHFLTPRTSVIRMLSTS